MPLWPWLAYSAAAVIYFFDHVMSALETLNYLKRSEARCQLGLSLPVNRGTVHVYFVTQMG